MTIPNPNNPKGRDELKSFFPAKTILSQEHFIALIESMLNKRDDKFYGIWKPGITYRREEVVIYEKTLWEMIAKDPICATSDQPPSKDNPHWQSLIIPVDDDDWQVIKEEGVMWAKVFEKIGIGIGCHKDEEKPAERPEARLDVRKLECGRWLLFPESLKPTQFTLLHYDPTPQISYLMTGLSLEEVNWLTDAAKGFVFRKGRSVKEEIQAQETPATQGQVMMALKPKRIHGGAELATLGLNVADPVAMLDISDGQRGQLLFTPDEKRDPALSILNLNPKCQRNYVAIGVGQTETTLVSDATNGFVFRRGGEYGHYCHEKDINQGNFLTIIRQHCSQPRPQVGIGNTDPQARLVIEDDQQLQVQLLPEKTTVSPDTWPVISILKDISSDRPYYLTSGLGETIAGWVSNAQKGFVFRHGQNTPHDLHQGETHLVIRENGHIGMRTENPKANLDIINKGQSGQFLFSLDRKPNPAFGIFNLKPECQEHYLTLGTDNSNAILVTDAPEGFFFKQGNEFGVNDSEVNINQGNTLVSIRQHRDHPRPQVGIGTDKPLARLDIYDDKQAQVQILPEKPKIDNTKSQVPQNNGNAAPVISLLNNLSATQSIYLTSGLGEGVAGWVTNAKKGFVFRQGELAIDGNQHCLDQGQTHLVIRENGYIGMGTEQPQANLDIINQRRSGQFLFHLDGKTTVNPALGIFNLRPGTKENYFTLGADNTHAILVTDSQYGFQFKYGEEFGTEDDSQININQGKTLLSIQPDRSNHQLEAIVSIRPDGQGRLGIGTKPIDYELDVKGMSRTLTLYQDTNSNQVCNPKPLTEVLEKIKLLQPVTFEWNAFEDMGQQIGLLAHAVDDIFPQVVRTASDGTQAIAYQNLVPVLIKGLQEVMAERDETRQKVETLETELQVFRKTMETELQELRDRLEQLECQQ